MGRGCHGREEGCEVGTDPRGRTGPGVWTLRPTGGGPRGGEYHRAGFEGTTERPPRLPSPCTRGEPSHRRRGVEVASDPRRSVRTSGRVDERDRAGQGVKRGSWTPPWLELRKENTNRRSASPWYHWYHRRERIASSPGPARLGRKLPPGRSAVTTAERWDGPKSRSRTSATSPRKP